jgi:PAS domain S-box-containing protein
VADVEKTTGALATDANLAAYLESPAASQREAALSAIHRAEMGTDVEWVELRDPSGRRTLDTRAHPPEDTDALATELARLGAARESSVVGPIRASADTLLYPVLHSVTRDGRLVGFVVRWNRLQIAGVIGPGARLALANANGSVWTTRGERITPPPAELGEWQGVASYRRPMLGEVLGMRTAVAGTPWIVLVEIQREGILSAPRRMVLGLFAFGLLLLLAGAATAWIVSGRLTGSIVELADSATAISTGDYSRRASVRGGGEVGTLSRAFNEMAESVAEANRQLKSKIEELAASEAQHRETRERMEHVITSSRAILYRYRIEDGARLDWISDNVDRLLGFRASEATERGWWEAHLHPEDGETFVLARTRLMEDGVATQEYRFRDGGGEYRWLRDEQRLLRDDRGEAIEVVGALTDVTEHRRLAVAKEVAEAANQAKSDFLSRMSHELRTPLNAVIGFGQLLQMDVETQENRESVEQILKAGRHLLALINEVLDIARIETGEMSLSVEPVSARAVMQESTSLVHFAAARQDVAVAVEDGPATEYYVRADQQRLKQVLLNLLSNAIKFNRPGGTVVLSCEEVGDDRLRLVVRDTGDGIPAPMMGRIFAPFERLAGNQSEKEGTGLGLALSKGLVEAMGGKLGVESLEGSGSSFWVELLLAQQPEVIGAPDEIPVLFHSEAPEGVRTVLFVEDNLANVRLMERVLQKRPHIRLLTAMQGSVGLELARERVPDLILLDRNLPDAPGEQILLQILRDPSLQHIPVVMVSGDAIASQVQRMLDLGARAYITKPFDIDHLLSTVDEILWPRTH